MGLLVTDFGISVQFCDRAGRPDGAPLYGKYAKLYGNKREKIIKAGRPASKEEVDHPGSDDWLTLVAVADTKERLDAILREPAVQNVPEFPEFLTSASSRRVAVEAHVGDVRRSLRDQITIGSGPIVSEEKGKFRIHCVYIKVLPVTTRMDSDHSLMEEFAGGTKGLEVLKQHM